MRLVPVTVAATLTAAIGAYTLYWFAAAASIPGHIDEWVEARRAEGLEVRTGDVAVSGYPLSFRVSFTEPAIADPERGWAWSADNLTAEARPWNLHEISLPAPGRHAISVAGYGEPIDLECLVDQARALLVFDDAWQIDSVVLDLEGLEVTGASMTSPARVGRMHLVSRFTSPAPATERTETVEATVVIEDAVLPAGMGGGLGREIADILVKADLLGPLPKGKLDVSLAAWRDAGGTIELKSLETNWGPLHFEADGTLALDSEMRPIGALTARIAGYDEVIDALVASDVVPLGDAFIARIAFNLLAKVPEDSGPPVLTVPVTVQEGGVYVGKYAFGRVPPVIDPSPQAKHTSLD